MDRVYCVPVMATRMAKTRVEFVSKLRGIFKGSLADTIKQGEKNVFQGNMSDNLSPEIVEAM